MRETKCISRQEAIDFICNKLRPENDFRVLVCRGLGEDVLDGEYCPYTEIGEDELENVVEGDFYDFQIWN